MHGHITSLAVARTHRKLGLATKLMNAAREHRGAAWQGGACCEDGDVDVCEAVQMQGRFASQGAERSSMLLRQHVARPSCHPLKLPHSHVHP